MKFNIDPKIQLENSFVLPKKTTFIQLQYFTQSCENSQFV